LIVKDKKGSVRRRAFASENAGGTGPSPSSGGEWEKAFDHPGKVDSGKRR